jgi:hypothetical protein
MNDGFKSLANNDDRAAGMSCYVLAHRPQEEPGETTMTARPDHKKIGIL